MEWILSLCLGIGLAACTGFRVFVPMLVASLATKLGWIDPTAGFDWLGNWTTMGLLAAATLIEIGAYYIPWVDNALDAIATPLAFVAGTILTTSFVEIDIPILKWVLGLIAGGGTAGLIQTGTAMLRAGSAVTTGGVGNPVVSTTENILSFGLSFLTVLLPLIAVVVIALIVVFIVRLIVTRGLRRRPVNGTPKT